MRIPFRRSRDPQQPSDDARSRRELDPVVDAAVNRFPQHLWPVAGEAESRLIDQSSLTAVEGRDPLLPVALYGERETTLVEAFRRVATDNERVTAAAFQVAAALHVGWPKPEHETASGRWVELNYLFLVAGSEAGVDQNPLLRDLGPLMAIPIGQKHYFGLLDVVADEIDRLDPRLAVRVK